MRHFGEALLLLQSGHRMARTGWNRREMYVFYVPQQTMSDGTIYLPYLALHLPDPAVVPWLASQTDLLATDWEIV